MPVVSVIVPIYNVEEYLERCVDSILNQTFTDFELILVNDGSTDNCGVICDRYAKKDPHIKVIHKENGGLSDARNAGIDVSAGQYMMFIDSDDYIDPKMLEILYERILNDGSDMALCNFLYVDENGTPIIEKNTELPIKNQIITTLSEAFLKLTGDKYWYYIIACNKLYKRFLFDEIRFPYGKQHEDEFVAHKVIGKCRSISCVDKPLYYYVQRSGSITNAKFSVKTLDVVEAFFNRSQYAFTHGLYRSSYYCLAQGRNHLATGFRMRKEGDEQMIMRTGELKKFYNKQYFKLLFKAYPLKKKFIATVFLISPRLYNYIIKRAGMIVDEQK